MGKTWKMTRKVGLYVGSCRNVKEGNKAAMTRQPHHLQCIHFMVASRYKPYINPTQPLRVRSAVA